jgi:2-dehydropantoate 2-reductase
MRICVIGAGAIGGLLAAKLAHAGEQVSVIARGPHLAAIARDGLVLHEEGQEIVARVKASDRIAEAGEQDLIVLGMKAHQVAAVAPDLPVIMGGETMVLTAQNGIPWWYFFGHGRPHEGVRLESVDPGGINLVASKLSRHRVPADGDPTCPRKSYVAFGTFAGTDTGRSFRAAPYGRLLPRGADFWGDR